LKIGSGNGKGKGKEKEPVWDGFIFEVPGFHDEVFWDWKDVITASEMQILKRLGFQMQVSQSVLVVGQEGMGGEATSSLVERRSME